MRPLFSLVAGSLAAYVVYRLVAVALSKYKRAATLQARGCREAPVFPSPDPLGITNVFRLIWANDAGRFLDYINERLAIVSKQEARPVLTFQTHIMRDWLYFTCDPKNVQALLATQFKDFELGPVRFGTFNAL
jgi:hypothetical protein